MDKSKTTNLISTRRNPLVFSMPAVILLCVYLAASALTYIEWVPDSMLTVGLYGFIALGAGCLWLNNKTRIYSHTIWCLIFVALCGISCLYAASTEKATAATTEMLKVLIFTLIIANVINNEGRMKGAMASFSIATIVLFIYLASTGQLELEEGERLGNELTGNANIFASLFMIAAMCSVYLSFFSEKKLFRIVFLACFIAQLVALAMSGGRKFFLVPVALFAGMQIVRMDKKGRTHLLKNTLLVGAALAVLWWAIFNVESLYQSIGYRMEGLMASITGEGEVDASTAERTAMIKKGLELWKESPLWGHGIDCFSALTHWGVYSHNNYVELLCDLGIIGLCAYYTFYIYLLYKLFKARLPLLKKSYWILLLVGLLFFDYGAVGYTSYLRHMLLVFTMQAAIYKTEEDGAANRKVDAR